MITDGDQVVILRRLGLNDVPSWVSKPPLATILGIGTNNDGYTRESITFPSGPAQAFLARQVIFLVLKERFAGQQGSTPVRSALESDHTMRGLK